ncbi:cytochrome b [Salicola sp. Rm-C-2C1-2]|uniref:cytochrome b n=1 Tax=Salicola sp. Rm-C-2C1-2 TaxID=3141321 RepID=UPI0032E43943
MQWRNSRIRWGIVSVGFHWVMGLVVVALFGVGLYMVDLGYMDPLRNVLPDWHRSVGLLLGAALVLRLLWRFTSPPPKPVPGHTRVEHFSAHSVHWLMYALMLAMVVSGYLISTADGRGVAVFDWFSVPAITGKLQGMEDMAGDWHRWMGWILVILAGLHGLAAFKHHFWDGDDTLRRMLCMKLLQSQPHEKQ